MAIEKPAEIATQLVPPAGAEPPGAWAKIGLAKANSTSASNINFVFIHLLLRLKSPPGGGSRHPRTAGLTLKGRHKAG
jgi:hypothetical protein